MRALGAAIALAVSLQAAGVPILAARGVSACCCHHDASNRKCHCPVCAHAREVASDTPLMKSCGGAALDAAMVLHFVPVTPPAAPAVVRTPRLPAPAATAAPEPPSPVREVPTPPPLARA